MTAPMAKDVINSHFQLRRDIAMLFRDCGGRLNSRRAW
jgi:hypothetical protein